MSRRWLSEVGLLLVLALTALGFFFSFLSADRMGPRQWDWLQHGAYMEYAHWGLTKFGEIPQLLLTPMHGTNLFAACGEAPSYSPALLLGRWLSTAALIKLNFALLLLGGVAGYVLLTGHLGWTLTTRWALFPVVFFNGGICARVFIGHQSIFPLLLLPLALAFLLRAIDGPRLFPDALGLALVLTMILMCGGGHPLIWTAYTVAAFALIYGVCRRRPARALGALAVGVGLFAGLAAWKLLPTLREYAGYSQPSLYGYLSLDQLLMGLTRADIPWNAGRLYERDYQSVMWWELTGYVGWAYLGVLAMGALAVLVRPKDEARVSPAAVAAFLITAAAVALTWNDFYFYLRKLPLPGSQSQRHTTRFIMVAVMVSTLIVGEGIRRARLRLPGRARVLLAVALAGLGAYFVVSYHRANAQWLRFQGDDLLAYDELPGKPMDPYFRADVIVDGAYKLAPERISVKPRQIELNLSGGGPFHEIVIPGLKDGDPERTLVSSSGPLLRDARGLVISLPSGTSVVTLSLNDAVFLPGRIVSIATVLALVVAGAAALIGKNRQLAH